MSSEAAVYNRAAADAAADTAAAAAAAATARKSISLYARASSSAWRPNVCVQNNFLRKKYCFGGDVVAY